MKMKWICAEPGLHLAFPAGSMETTHQLKRVGHFWHVYRGWHYTGHRALTLGEAKLKVEGRA